jgi:hypothetical protein
VRGRAQSSQDPYALRTLVALGGLAEYRRVRDRAQGSWARAGEETVTDGAQRLHARRRKQRVVAVVATGQLQDEAVPVALRLTCDEARWLATAINITQRLLEGLRFESPQTQVTHLEGLAALHRVAAQMPTGITPFYP